MKRPFYLLKLLSLLLLLSCSTQQFAQISIPNDAFTNSQDFSTLANTGTSSTVPLGWAFSETGANANATYTAGTGSSNAGDTYSFGAAASTERAFGGLQSGSLNPTVGVCYTNNTCAAITELTISYTGETWRVGTANRTDGIQFQYNQSTTAINGAGTWTSFSALDYFNPGQATGSGSMQHSATISSAITGLNIAPGATFCFRWNDFNATGGDDGIAVDDYTLNNIVTGAFASANFVESGGTTDVTEGGTTDDFTVVLTAQPTANVTVTITPDAQTTVSPTSLVFTSANWNVPQTVTVTAVDDAAVESSPHTSLIFHGFTSTDPCFDELETPLIVVNVTDNDAPGVPVVLNCPVDLAISSCSTQVQVDVAFAAWLATASGSGGCGGVLTNDGGTTGPPLCGGSKTVTFTFTSTCAPLVTTCQATFTVLPASMPTLTCPTPLIRPVCQTRSQDSIALQNWVNTISFSGGCNAMFNFNGFDGRPPSSCGGTKTLNVTYTSSCAAPLNCSSTFTIPAPTPPNLICPGNQTEALGQTQAQINAAFVTWLSTAIGTGGCNGVLSNNNVGAPPATGGAVTVTFTYAQSPPSTPFNGACPFSTQTCQATFTIASPVVLTCPANAGTAACQTQAAVNTAFATWLATATASGGCNGILTNDGGTTGPPACGGSKTVLFTYSSTCAPLITTCSANFTVASAPTVVLNCPVNTTVGSCQTQDAVNAAFAAWLLTANGSGGCGGSLANDNIGAPSACGGSTMVTFTYTSTCPPFSSNCSATFTVAPAPTVVLNCPMAMTTPACQTQGAVNAAFSAWLLTANASGGCSGNLANNNIGAPSACGGSTMVTFTYTSTCPPFSSNCTATFTVAAPPTVVLTCPVATTASACLTQAEMNTAYANWLATASASGGCSGNLSNNSIGAPLICSPTAVTRTVTFTYTSTCAPLTTTCTSTFTVPAYPDFTVPANTASTVACPALIVQPVPPVVLDACGKTLTPTGPAIVNSPNPITCEGTRTFTFTFTDCSGHVKTWSHVTTVEREPFTVPANGGATVDCPDDTDVQPTPPVVTSNCGEVLVPVVSASPKNDCEGDRVYSFVYTDCEGNTATWTFLYHVEYLDFTVPPSEFINVECPLNAMLPTPPTVFDNCGNLLAPIGPLPSSSTNAQGCEGSRSYEWVYTDCEGNTHTWGRYYNFLYSADFSAPADEEHYVSCLAYAVALFPQVLYDFCGQLIKTSAPVMTQSIAANGCTGWRKFSFVYTDCGGHSHPWSFTYYINDDQAPLGTCPGTGGANGPVSVNVTDLACIEDVPCPDDYDFDDKIEEMFEAGNYFDVCYGSELFVTLDDYTDLWECSDPDGNGVFTFGRTFYFRIADRCGNEYPSLCEVTYSGACQPLETFPQEAWGIAGGEPGTDISATTTDVQVITTLLGSGPVVVGGTSRSITLNDAQCVVNMLPGTGGPAVLSNCQQVNCTGCNPMGIGGIKNALAANAIALELNIRYNVQYNGLPRANIRNQGLGCVYLHPCIYYCETGGDCRVHFFDAAGTEHSGAYTVGGLQDLVNLYLSGSLNMTVGQKVIYGTALNQSLLSLNAYYGDQTVAAACDNLQPDNSELDKLIEEYGLGFTAGTGNVKPNFEVTPNPASGDVNFKLANIAEGQAVSLEIINALGQKVMHREFGAVSYVNERLDLSGLGSGLYFVNVKVGEERYEQKLVIGK